MTARRIEKAVPLLLIPLALPALWHLLIVGLPQGSADGLLHLFRLALLERHVTEGMLYPRWMPELVLGRGYPLLNFYGPASYYFALFFRLAGLSLPPAMIAAFAVLLVTAGGGAYLLARDLFPGKGRLPGLVAGVAYMYAPYLLTNIYIRGALAEVAAQALLPWIFWSLGRLMTRRANRVPYLIFTALSLAALAATHNITLLFLPPAWLAYATVLWFAGGKRPDDLWWAVAGGAAAVGVSAFFTVPLMLERQYLASTAYSISAVSIPENVWTARNFLDLHPVFEYTSDLPFQLGLVQLALAVIGIAITRRRDIIWRYWFGLALVSALLIGAWALPLWLGSSLLLIAQFPWRLLALLSLPPALFTAGTVAALPRPAQRGVAAAALIALIIWANTPRLPAMTAWLPDEAPGIVAGISQFESDTGALGTSNGSEFMPKWVRSLAPGLVASDAGAPVAVAVTEANDFRLSVRTEGETAGPLRLMTSYFPGWRAADETGARLEIFPTTDSGLLTVNAPAGDHTITVLWEPTLPQWIGAALTVASLFGLAALALARRSARALTLPLLIPVVFLVASAFARPRLEPVTAPSAPLALGGVTNVGARLAVEPRGVWVYPYWRVDPAPAADTRIRWQVRDAAGETVLERETRPYHNTASVAEWPPNTIVDDAHFLPLPDGLAAGSYEVSAQLLTGAETSSPATLGRFDLAADVARPAAPTHSLDVTYANRVALRGYDAPPTTRHAVPPHVDAVVEAGDALRYTLHWQALTSLTTNYHGFLHLVDAKGETLATRDQLAGGSRVYSPTRLWGTGNVLSDDFPLRIPANAESGVYWPTVGLYDFTTLERLTIDAGEAAGQNAARLRPIKVLGRPVAEPQERLDIRVADLARLTGYRLDLPAGGLVPGATFTVTLFFRAERTPETGYTRFLHVWSPTLGMAGQQDAEPAGGRNPTWSWAPGEVVADAATLTIAPDAPPGNYELRVGLYNPADGARLPLTDHAGARPTDDIAVIAGLTVVAAQ